MTPRSCLRDPTVTVIADTSVVINLHATGCAETILEALPNRFFVVSQVLDELETDRRTGRNDAGAIAASVASGRITVVQLGDAGRGSFLNLVSGSAARTLDDGEAATIASALEMELHGIPLIDERKANRVCAERFPGLATGSTVDVLAQDSVRAALGRNRLAEATFNALYAGRMRVLPHHVGWVVNLIGPQRAAQCPSLPRSVRST